MLVIFLAGSVICQTIVPTLPEACSSVVLRAEPLLKAGCGESAILIIGNVNPLSAFVLVGQSAKTNEDFCSLSCFQAVTSFCTSVGVCGDLVLYQGTDAKASQCQALGTALLSIGCGKSPKGLCLSAEVYPALVSKGLKSDNTASFTNAFISFASDPAVACSACVADMVKAIKANLTAFGTLQSILNAAIETITATCGAKPSPSVTRNEAETAGITLLALCAVAGFLSFAF